MIRIADDLRRRLGATDGRRRDLWVVDGDGTVVRMFGGQLGAAALAFDPRCFVEVDFGADCIRGADWQIGFGGLENRMECKELINYYVVS